MLFFPEASFSYAGFDKYPNNQDLWYNRPFSPSSITIPPAVAALHIDFHAIAQPAVPTSGAVKLLITTQPEAASWPVYATSTFITDASTTIWTRTYPIATNGATSTISVVEDIVLPIPALDSTTLYFSVLIYALPVVDDSIEWQVNSSYGTQRHVTLAATGLLSPFGRQTVNLGSFGPNFNEVQPDPVFTHSVPIVGHVTPSSPPQTVPMWVSKYRPEQSILTPPQLSTAKSVNLASYISVKGSAHAPTYTLESKDCGTIITFTGPSKKHVREQLRTYVSAKYNVSPSVIVIFSSDGYSEYLARVNNKQSHALIGNTDVTDLFAGVTIEGTWNYHPDEEEYYDSIGRVDTAEQLHQPAHVAVCYQNAMMAEELDPSSESVEESDHDDFEVAMMDTTFREWLNSMTRHSVTYNIAAYVFTELNMNSSFMLLDDEPEGEVATRPRGPAQTRSLKEASSPAKAKAALKDDTPPKSAADKLASQKGYIRRKAELVKRSQYAALPVVDVSASDDTRKLIFEEAWGKHWDMGTMTPVQFYVWGRLNRVPHCLVEFMIALSLIETKPTTISTRDLAKYENVYDQLKDELVWSWDFPVLLQEAEKHNKEVHSLVGNTSYISKMEEINASKRMGSYLELQPKYNLAALNSAAYATLLLTMPTDVTPSLQNIPETACIRAATIPGAGQASLPGRCVPLPVTNVIPRALRVAGGGVIAAPRLFRTEITTLPYMGAAVVPTNLSTTMITAAINANMNMGRADNTCLNGFNAIEMAQYARLTALRGFSPVLHLLKMYLLHDIVAWNRPTNVLPMHTLSSLDSYSVWDGVAPVTPLWNGPGPYGEDCGDLAAIFPFEGIAGEIRFHVCVSSVAPENRGSAVVMPEALLYTGDVGESAISIALFAMMWAPAPHALASYITTFNDRAGGNPAVTSFVPAASTVHVPGMTSLDIILPRQTTAANPTQQAQANLMVALTPKWGPTGTPTVNANTSLDTCYIAAAGAGITTYNLCEYLRSWSESFDTTTISFFLSRYQSLIDTSTYSPFVRDFVDYATAICPTHILTTDGQPAELPIGSATQFGSTYPFGNQRVVTTADFPGPGRASGDFTLTSPETIAWNKIALGLASLSAAVPLVTTASAALPEWMDSAYSPFWTTIRGTLHACLCTSWHVMLGASAEIWNVSFTQSPLQAYKAVCRGSVSTMATTSGGSRLGTANAPLLAALYEVYFRASLGTDPSNITKINVYDTFLPFRAAFPGVVTVAGAEVRTAVPITVCDAWLMYLCSDLPMSQRPLPLPGLASSTVGFSDPASMKALNTTNANGLSGYRDRKTMLPTQLLDQTLDLSDEHIWNGRIEWLSGLIPQDFNGNAVANWGAGEYPRQRNLDLVFMPDPDITYLSANTMCYPRLSVNAARFFFLGGAAAVSPIRKIETNLARMDNRAWQLASGISSNAVPDTPVQKLQSRFLRPGKAQPSSKEPLLGGGNNTDEK
jgi:hypothetical protein